MEAARTYSHTHPRSVLQQTNNNATFWIGTYRGDHQDHYAGQTFVSPEEGELDYIRIYSSSVPSSCEMKLSLHVFNKESKTWGQEIGSALVKVDGQHSGSWIAFDLSGIHLKQGGSYGFRLSTNALVGVGEAAGSSKNPPFDAGQEWSATSDNRMGQFYSYFSLMFKVEMH